MKNQIAEDVIVLVVKLINCGTEDNKSLDKPQSSNRSVFER